MDPQEIRDKIMAAINGIIKDEPGVADTNIHDVLAAKMRDRISPTTNPDEDPNEVDLDPDQDDPEAQPTPEGVTPDTTPQE